jgi:hypothetical protein
MGLSLNCAHFTMSVDVLEQMRRELKPVIGEMKRHETGNCLLSGAIRSGTMEKGL